MNKFYEQVFDNGNRRCSPCLMTFNRHAYYNASDYVLTTIVTYEVNQAVNNSTWRTENGVQYFYTDDIIGGSKFNDDSKGSCIKVYTGLNEMQGRVKSKIYALQHFIMKAECAKDTKIEGRTVIDVKEVDATKLRNSSNAEQ